VVFGEPLDFLIICGGGVIVIAITQLAYFEKR